MSGRQHKIVTAQEFQLVDEDGRCRALLTMKQGQPVLCLNDEAETTRASLSLGEGGRPHLTLWDAAGGPLFSAP